METQNQPAVQASTNAAANSGTQQATQQPTLVTQAASAPVAAQPEVKPNEAAASDAAGKEQAKPDGQAQAPVSLELKLPDGSLMLPEHLEDLSQFAKEKGLSQEQAQEMINRQSDVLADFQALQVEKFQQAREDWRKQSMEDKEIGGEHLTKNVEMAKRALDSFGSQSLKQALEETGYGNHPEIVRLLVKIGKAMGEDKILVGGNSTGPKTTIEERFYGKQN